MSDPFADLRAMHDHYGVTEVVAGFDREKMQKFLSFRRMSMQEELDEFDRAVEQDDPENAVDALIDLLVFTIGTLDLWQVDIAKAWDVVHKANMSKRVGIKANRPNPLGLPDLMKPEGWVAPTHEGNHGRFPETLPID